MMYKISKGDRELRVEAGQLNQERFKGWKNHGPIIEKPEEIAELDAQERAQSRLVGMRKNGNPVLVEPDNVARMQERGYELADAEPVVEDVEPVVEDVADNPILDALGSLDADNDEHWTKSGKPAIPAVAAILGNPQLTRAMIEDAAPDFERP